MMMTHNCQDKIHEIVKRMIPSAIVSFLFALVLCVCIPMSTYFQNVNEFSFDHIGLLYSLVPYALSVFGAVLFVQLLIGYFCPAVDAGGGRKISILQILLLGVLAGLLCEGMFVSYRLPQLSGIIGSFLSIKRTLVSTAGWLVGIAVVFTFWRRLTHYFNRIVLALFFVYAAVLGDAMLTSQEKIKITIDTVDVMDNLAFHPRDNVIIIVADTVSTFATEEVLARNPDLYEKLDGFTLFANNIGPGHQTSWAIPAILRGQVFNGGGYKEFSSGVHQADGSLVERFQKLGFDVFVTSILPRFSALINGKRDFIFDGVDADARIDSLLYTRLGFRFIPYFFKRYAEPYVYDLISVNKDQGDKFSPTKKIDKIFSDLIQKLDVKTSRPTVHCHHYVGAHPPFEVDGMGNTHNFNELSTEKAFIGTTEFVLRNFCHFLDELRTRGMYDDATIVLMSDHGEGYAFRKFRGLTSFNTALFMVKPPKAHHKMDISLSPSSSTYMPRIVEALHSGISFQDVVSEFPSERRFLEFGMSDVHVYEVETDDVKSAEITRVDIQPKDTPTPLLLNHHYTLNRTATSGELAIPSKLDNLNPASGIGIDYGYKGIPSELGFLVGTSAQKISIKLDIMRLMISPTPVFLTWRDKISGLETTLPLNERPYEHQEVTLPDVCIDKNSREFVLEIDVDGSTEHGFCIYGILIFE